MSQDKIVVRGAREHNLKNVTIEIPRDKLVVITGLSGSGKSSLAFDTIYAEGQRRYVESLSAYARQFLGQMNKPDVDYIEGLSPAVSIDQKATSKNPRSSVGTVTEIYDYLRLLYARMGRPYCPKDHIPIERQTVDQIVDVILAQPEGSRLQILAPQVRGRKGEFRHLLAEAVKSGFVRARVDGQIYELAEDIPLEKNIKHTIEIVIDRLILKENVHRRLADSIETALKIGKGLVNILIQKPEDEEPVESLFSEHFACPECGFSMPELEPRLFSFNSPFGACEECNGLGVKQVLDRDLICPDPSLPVIDALVPFAQKAGAWKSWWGGILRALGEHYGFDVTKPLSEIQQEYQELIWMGSDVPLKVEMIHQGGHSRVYQTHWEGAIPRLKRLHENSESDSVRRNFEQYMRTLPCKSCGGKRLKPDALAVKVNELTISELCDLSIDDLLKFFSDFALVLTQKESMIGERLIKEILERIHFLRDVGLGYLTLNRTAGSLSGGEAQRIRLATQIGSGLMGCLYVLDEPSIGLHQRDNQKLIQTLERLRNLGNTVLVVEHDEETMRAADWLIEMGPAAGEHGGEVVAQGNLEQFLKSDCSTAKYLSGQRTIPMPPERRKPGLEWIRVHGARGHNLKNIDVEIPLGLFVCITGVSGSGKSTLIQETLFPRLMHEVYGAKTGWAPHQAISGMDSLDKVIDIDQSPIGRTPRSNPATYTGAFDQIRELFAMTQDARMRGYTNGRFSFNVKGGRCEACHGDGMIKIEMHFLPDVYVPCEVCKGRRYNHETLEVKYKGKNISEVLEMTIEEACDFFCSIPKISRKLLTLQDVGLGYIRLGQPATTLSGGEAQRIKLAAELLKRSTGSTIYILDEPTTGLHFEDIEKLLVVLHRLVDQGNTVLVIEHNLDVIKTADWLIDMGPEGGVGGGEVVGFGPPEELEKNRRSYTGFYLKSVLC